MSKFGLTVAIANGDPLLPGVLRRRLFDDGPEQRAIGLDPVADSLELRSVPLNEPHGAATFVVLARDLDGLQQTYRAKLLQAIFVDVDMFEAPAHLLSRERHVSEFRLRDANGFDIQDTVVDPEIVVTRSHALGVRHVALSSAE